MTTSKSLLSRQPNVSHHPSSLSAGRSHVSRTYCSMWACRASTYFTLPCPCLRQRCCLFKLRQLCTPLGQSLTCAARSFGSDPHITNSHTTSTSRRRSSASAGTLAQYTPMLAAKQDNDAEFCIVFQTSFIFLLWSSLFHTSWSFPLQLGNFLSSLPAVRMCLPVLRFVLTPPFFLDRFER